MKKKALDECANQFGNILSKNAVDFSRDILGINPILPTNSAVSLNAEKSSEKLEIPDHFEGEYFEMVRPKGVEMLRKLIIRFTALNHSYVASYVERRTKALSNILKKSIPDKYRFIWIQNILIFS